MASVMPHQKRNSFQRLSRVLQLGAPFSRSPSDSTGTTSSRAKRSFSPRTHETVSATSLQDVQEIEYTPTASIISAGDSLLSSPSAPLLPLVSPKSTSSTELPSSPPLPVPPTVNDLAAEEKMKLMRKMRKLSRILGEVPVLAEEDNIKASSSRLSDVAETTERPTSPVSAPAAYSATAVAKRAFRRSLTMGASMGAKVSLEMDMQRTKSLSTLRPALTVSPPDPTKPDSSSSFSKRESDIPPFSPITFARLEDVESSTSDLACDRSSPPSPVTSPTAEDARLADCDATSMNAPLDSQSAACDDPGSSPRRRDSTASSVLLADQKTEQVQRLRAAKLSRHLGDHIPPEVLRCATSPLLPTRDTLSPPPSSKPHSSSLSRSLLSPSSTSARLTKRRSRRPLSLDFRAMKSINTAASSPSSPSAADGTFLSTGPSSLKRNKTMWTRGAYGKNDENAADFSPLGELGPVDSLSEKARALNVKRARKMAQLFGDNPPNALFQISSFDASSLDDAASRSSLEGQKSQRDSLTTIISISTASLAPSHGNDRKPFRDSYMSIVTTSSELSALVFTDAVDEEDEPPVKGPVEPEVAAVLSTIEQDPAFSPDNEPSSLSDAPGASTPSLPVQLPLSISIPSTKSNNPKKRDINVRPSTSPNPSTTHFNSSDIQHRTLRAPTLACQPPRTPPTPPPFANLIAPPSPRPATAPSDMTKSSSTEFQARRKRAAKLSKFFGVGVSELVEVLPTEMPPFVVPADVHKAPLTTVAEAKSRRGFLGAGEDKDVKELDMGQVIEQLRKMKSH